MLALGPRTQGGGPDFAGLLRLVWEDLHCPYVLCEGGGTWP